MPYQEKWPPRPGAAPPEAPKNWGTGAYSTVLFQARSGSGGGSVGAVAAADAADAADAAAAAVVATCAHLTELGEQLAAHMAKFGVLAIMCATILAAMSLST